MTGCPRCHRDSASRFLSHRIYTFGPAADPNSSEDGEAGSRRNGELHPPQRPRSMGSIQALQVMVPFLWSSSVAPPSRYVCVDAALSGWLSCSSPRAPHPQTAQAADGTASGGRTHPYVESRREGVPGNLLEAGPPFPGGRRGRGGAGMMAESGARPASALTGALRARTPSSPGASPPSTWQEQTPGIAYGRTNV